MNHVKDFEKIVRGLCHRRERWRIFSDFVEMAALAFSNVITPDQEREARYLKIVSTYEKEEVAEFPKLLALTVDALEPGGRDFLGEAFMSLELGSHWHGQFFTPIDVCRMMAEMTIDAGVEEMIRERGFFTVQEPAAGAGAMVIALADVLRVRKINPQQTMHVTAIDVDATAAHMAYVQFSLLHIPAIVHVGNTLTLETRASYRTPAHVLGFWDFKLRGHSEIAPPIEPGPPAPVPITTTEGSSQLLLGI